MRYIKISIETALRWYNSNDDELKTLAIQTYPELSSKKIENNIKWKKVK